VGGVTVEPARLLSIVEDMGGGEIVERTKQWSAIARKFGIDTEKTTSAAFVIKRMHMGALKASTGGTWDEANEEREYTMSPIVGGKRPLSPDQPTHATVTAMPPHSAAMYGALMAQAVGGAMQPLSAMGLAGPAGMPLHGQLGGLPLQGALPGMPPPGVAQVMPLGSRPEGPHVTFAVPAKRQRLD